MTLTHADAPSLPALRHIDDAMQAARLLTAAGAHRQAITELQEALDLAQPHGGSLEADIRQALAHCHRAARDYTTSIAVAEHVPCGSVGDRSSVDLAAEVVKSLLAAGHHGRADQVAARLARSSRASGDPHARVAALTHAAVAAQAAGDLDRGLALCEEAMAGADAITSDAERAAGRAQVLVLHASLLLLTRVPERAAQAQTILTGVLRGLTTGPVPDGGQVMRALIELARAQLILGFPQAAVDTSMRALRHRPPGRSRLAGRALLLLGEAHDAAGDTERAALAFTQAAAELAETGYAHEESAAWLALADVLTALGAHGQAREAYRTAMTRT
jgi:tetratricopeptide (TPR) repeat protein